MTLTRKVANGTLDTPDRHAGAHRSKGRLRPLSPRGRPAPSPAAPIVQRDRSAPAGTARRAPTRPKCSTSRSTRPSYKPGETAKLKVATRQGGKLLVTVLGSGLITHRAIDLPNGGGEVPLEVGRRAGAPAPTSPPSLYRAARREGAAACRRRAIGLKWLAVDQSERTLKVALDAPQKIGSGAKLVVPLKIDGLARGEEARVTVAAVDVGILNLTRFEAPKPEGWFYAQTKLGTEIRDLYGRLIDGMRAERGQAALGRRRRPAAACRCPAARRSRRMLALHSGIVRVGAGRHRARRVRPAGLQRHRCG